MSAITFAHVVATPSGLFTLTPSRVCLPVVPVNGEVRIIAEDSEGRLESPLMHPSQAAKRAEFIKQEYGYAATQVVVGAPYVTFKGTPAQERILRRLNKSRGY